ncbi:GerAB/ArcD/ProY family transporter [Alicyclobacillus sp. TC]|uniref:Spore germination protein (Amino acid permease) n=2 Tax=Alicyclobacillus tolerans TaxID=90970 RepID=A0A1M6WK69_9BACL|nr:MULTISPECIES: GerAB/ArcD/ProY family transporter [Alicyclobacillus]MDP9728287.1 spore germination protein (amino acid permease) [Alicyclobacillus tengchongensis]QRF23492.1 GerAB/ArcD/ProY family transporter [Alicyclobacillus sp. TC]SHK93989.1 spore germination protein (amino acid permease) [Alicyclobacillus montanus]
MAIRPFEAMLLSLITLPVMGHLFMVAPILQAAGRDIWISILLGSLLFLGLARWSVHIVVLRQGKSLWESANHFPKPLLTIFKGYFLLYNVALAILSSALFISFVKINFLPNTPTLILVIFLMLIVAYSLSRGQQAIYWTGTFLAGLAMLTGMSVTLIDHHSKDWLEWLPLLEHGWHPVWIGLGVSCCMWTECLSLLFQLPYQHPSEKLLYRWWAIGIILNAIMMITPAMGVISIYGLEWAQTFLFPTEETLRSMDLILIDRFDTYGLGLAAMGTLMRIAISLGFAMETFWDSEKHQTYILIFFLPLLTVTTFILSRSFTTIEACLIGYIGSSVFLVILVAFFLCFQRYSPQNREKHQKRR